MVGQNRGIVEQSYETGAVNGTPPGCCVGNSIGGLVGGNFGTITYSYATGAVVGWGSVGGLVGTGGNIAQSYWDTQTSGQIIGVGDGNVSGANGLTSAQARTQSSYVGWDFAGTWFMIDGETRPFLQSEYSTTITNAHQLQLMAMGLSANYTLANDIDPAPRSPPTPTEIIRESGVPVALCRLGVCRSITALRSLPARLMARII